jgi:hypothetical protein
MDTIALQDFDTGSSVTDTKLKTDNRNTLIVINTISSRPLRYTLAILPRLNAVVFFIILFLWIFEAEDGLGFRFVSTFGWHALMMALFVVVFTQESVMAFTMYPWLSKRGWAKPFHVLLHIIGIICCIIGLVAIVRFKALSPRPVDFPFYTLYTPHSWLGILFLSFWVIQLMMGVGMQVASLTVKQEIRKYHKFLGRVVYILGLVVCGMGVADMQSADLAGSVPPYVSTTNFTKPELGNMGYYPNSLLANYSGAMCMLLVFQAILVYLPQLPAVAG